MKDIGWIDIENKDHKTVSITVLTYRKLNTPLTLRVEEFLPEEERWHSTKFRIKNFTYKKVDSRHTYCAKWMAPEAYTLFRVTYKNKDEFVASDENIIIHGKVVNGGSTQLLDSKGNRPKNPRQVIGRTFLTTHCVIRAVEAFTIVDNFYGGALFKDVPPPYLMNALPKKHILLYFCIAAKNDKKINRTFIHWWAKTNKDGYIYSPEHKGGTKNPLSTVLQFPSSFFSVENGRMKAQFAWFCVFISNSRSEILQRINVIKDSFRQPNKKLRILTARTMADSFINIDGSMHDLVLYQYPDLLRKDVKGMKVQRLYLPLKTTRNGKMMRIFKDYTSNNKLFDELVNFPEVKENDIYKYNYDFLTAPKNAELGGDLVRKIRKYFSNHPEDLVLVSRMTIRSFIRELFYCLTMLFREKYFKVTGSYSQSMTEQEYNKKWKISQQETEKLFPKAVAMFSMGLHEHLRLDIGYKMGRDILMNTRIFFQNFFEEKVEITYTSDSIEPIPKKDCDYKLGLVASNLAIKYYLGLQQIQKGAYSEKDLKIFQKNFEANLLPLGIYEDTAEDIVSILNKYLSGINYKKISYNIESISLGVDPKKLRHKLREPMIQAHKNAYRLWNNLFYETQVDIYLQYSLLRDYPYLTKIMYDALHINLDPNKYPKGFPGGREPNNAAEVRRLNFGEYAVYRCGTAFEKGGKGITYLVKFFEFIFLLGSIELLAAKGLKGVLVNLTQGLANSFLDFGKSWSETQDAYAKAITGLGSLDTAKKKKATFYFQTIFNILNIGFGTYSSIMKKPNPMTWTSLGSIYSKIVTKQRAKSASYVASQFIERSARKVIRNKLWRRKLHKGLQGLVKFTLNHAGKFLYAKVLNKTGLNKMTVKDFLEFLYFEAILKAEISNDTKMLEQLEGCLKDISETLKKIEKTHI